MLFCFFFFAFISAVLVPHQQPTTIKTTTMQLVINFPPRFYHHLFPLKRRAQCMLRSASALPRLASAAVCYD